MEREPLPERGKRLGDHPVVARVGIGSAAAEIAARDSDGELLLGPYGRSAGAEVCLAGTLNQDRKDDWYAA